MKSYQTTLQDIYYNIFTIGVLGHMVLVPSFMTERVQEFSLINLGIRLSARSS